MLVVQSRPVKLGGNPKFNLESTRESTRTTKTGILSNAFEGKGLIEHKFLGPVKLRPCKRLLGRSALRLVEQPAQMSGGKMAGPRDFLDTRPMRQVGLIPGQRLDDLVLAKIGSISQFCTGNEREEKKRQLQGNDMVNSGGGKIVGSLGLATAIEQCPQLGNIFRGEAGAPVPCPVDHMAKTVIRLIKMKDQDGTGIVGPCRPPMDTIRTGNTNNRTGHGLLPGRVILPV